MPNLKQHSRRVRFSLAWFDAVKLQDTTVFLNPLINEYFYSALHMFEACAVAFPGLMTQTDFYSHVERNAELGRIVMQALHPLQPMTAPYETLSGLSRRARYIQISRQLPVSPIKPKDLKTARDSFEVIRATIESHFVTHATDKTPPWHRAEDLLDS